MFVNRNKLYKMIKSTKDLVIFIWETFTCLFIYKVYVMLLCITKLGVK
ncbi:hypothetical protein LALCM10_170066 [Dellaglioa algida]|nr:hypothetical protein LALCM10_170066 [Dellaglioa algida]